MRETVIEKHLRLEVAKAGGASRKFSSVHRPNNPDQIVIWPGEWLSVKKLHRSAAKVDFVECKAPGKKARSGQIREHNRLRALGATVIVLDTKELVDLYVESNRGDA